METVQKTKTTVEHIMDVQLIKTMILGDHLLMTMIQKEVFFDIEFLFCAILRNPPLSGCDIKTKKNSIELREKFSKLDNVLFHHI